MNYKNTKEGFKKLYIAAILMIISDLSGFISNKTEPVYVYISLVLVICAIVAFFMNIKGLKLCAQDDSGYNQAYIFSIVGLIGGIISVVLTAIFKTEWLDICTKSFTSFCEIMTVWEVLMTSSYILEKKDNATLAKNARTTAYFHLIVFIASLYLSYYKVDIAAQLTTELVVVGILAIVTAVIAIIAEIRYFLFLRKMQNAL